MIMLQRINPQTEENEGGLFINPEHISALIPTRAKKMAYDGSIMFWCQILLSNGVVYLTPFDVAEITDILREYNQMIGKYPKEPK